MAELPIHLIGHSRGGSVMSELARLLGEKGIWVHQLTLLDPHPKGFDPDVQIWENILFADNFYEEDFWTTPNSYAIQNAYNENLTYRLPGGYGDPPLSVTANHSDVHLWYHGTVNVNQNAFDGDVTITDAIRTNWYWPTEYNGQKAGFYYSRLGGGGNVLDGFLFGYYNDGDFNTSPANRVSLARSANEWPSLITLTHTSSGSVQAGNSLPLEYVFQSYDSASAVTVYLDNDQNPYNGSVTSLSLSPTPDQSLTARGTRTVNTGGLIPITTAPGNYYIYAKITNPNGSRYLYDLNKVWITAPPNPTPVITSVSPATLPPSGSPQTITVTGSNFIPPGNANASSLVFYDPSNTPYPRTPTSVTATSMQYGLTVGSATGPWKVKVVNGSVESPLYTFTVAASTALLTGVSITGPATLSENSGTQYAATAFFNDGTSQNVTYSAGWSVNSGITSLSSGYLSAGSVSSDTVVTLTASYTYGGTTKSTTANVTILNVGGSTGTQTIHAIVNGGFEAGSSPWAPSGYAGILAGSYPHAGSYYGYLCNANSASGAFAQFFPIPAGTVSATLSFYLNVVSSETAVYTKYDTMDVNLGTANEQYVGSIAQFSNLDKGGNVAGSYVYKSYNIMPMISAYKGQSLYLTFSGQTDTSNPTIFRIDDVDLTLVVNNPVALTGLSIRGPSSIREGLGDGYWADAIFSDGTTQTISPNSWSENSAVTTISGDGFLSAGQVSSDTQVTVTASYTFNGVTQQASKTVTVIDGNPPVTFTSLSIGGALSLYENSSSQYNATAIFSDGSFQSVTPTWAVASGPGAISSAGLFTVGDIPATTTTTITASYTSGGVTRTASQQVSVINIPPPPTLTSLTLIGPGLINENAAAQYTAIASLSDSTTQPVVASWSVSPAALASITALGILSANEVVNNTNATVTASYTLSGITRTAQQVVTIINLDKTPPTVAISSPTPGQTIKTNDSGWLIQGTATDNFGVAAVFFNLNNAGWLLAAGTNSWQASVSLIAGTNTILAYAQDAAGNNSTTNTVACNYVPTGLFQLRTNGLGSVSPNYNNTQLELGKAYTIVATPVVGFAFSSWNVSTNWGAGVATFTTNLTFVMQAGLTVQANFADVSRPTNTITAPTAGQRWSNSVFTVTGTARDNVQVTGVSYQLNGTGWNLATPVNGWSNWMATLNLTIPGTNILQAYAVDAAGNQSSTNSVSFVYVASAPLQVQTVGKGTISPNYSNAVLEIGKSYSMTAAPASGFTFVNWAGSQTTNGATLTFLMASNLSFTANFADTNKPAIAVIAPTAGQRWSNAVFTASGTATDNWQVASVQYQLNGGIWTSASGTTNWSAPLTLTPGTNTLAAYATDTTGNNSTTNSVSFVYVLTATLTVSTNGNGTVNPNYNGQTLAINNSYSMTATAGAGFAFTNWTGGTSLPLAVLTNGTTLTFMMQSNLTLQANFVDTNKPVIAITAPTPLLSWSNSTFTVTGTASDNVAVSNVFVSLNNGAFASPATANGWANWSTNVNLVAGTNTIAAYAVDTSGNVSPTNSVSFLAFLSTPLTVKTNGNGSVNPNYNGQSLVVGNTYSMTATPATGSAFTNWTGGTSLPLAVLTNGPTLTFVMQSNLTLQANFYNTNRPTVNITSPTPGQMWSNAAFTVSGTVNSGVTVSNLLVSFNNGIYASPPTANNWATWTTNVNLLAGTNTIAAYAVDTSGNVSPTNSVSFLAFLSTPLTVLTNGSGTVNPNYNGQSLVVGNTYSMTATAGTGFAFTNWTGGTSLPLAVLTNGATLTFVMQSNLTLQANFADTNKPVVAITAPTPWQLWSNSTFTVTGTAGDNVAVSNVFVSVNNGTFAPATTANNWANWSTNASLLAGTNTFAAYALDTSGNVSPTNSVSLNNVGSILLIRALGLGKISPNYSNAFLTVGQTYNVTSTPAIGFVFTNWTVSTNWIGGTAYTSTNLQFTMQPNLTLQVSFVETSRPSVVISSPFPNAHTNALPTVVGTASDNWQVAGVWYRVNSNAWSLVTSTNSYKNWTTLAPLKVGTNVLNFYAANLGGNYSTTNSLSLITTNTFQLQLAVGNSAALTAGGFTFDLLLAAGLNGHIQVSTNLTSWVTLTNFSGTNASITFQDPGATNTSVRFYRAVIP